MKDVYLLANAYKKEVPAKRIEKDADSITRYYKSRKSNQPFIATLSHDKKWVAATYTRETGKLWTNPGRSCQHADPVVSLGPGKTRSLHLKTFVSKGTLNEWPAAIENPKALP